MNNDIIIDETRQAQIAAAENYLAIKQQMLPSTITYDYKETYNYILNKIPRFFR